MTREGWAASVSRGDRVLAADLYKVGADYRLARKHTERTRVRMLESIRMAYPSLSESEIARIAGVTRMTVRKALGK